MDEKRGRIIPRRADMKGTARPSKHPSPPGVSDGGARGDEDTQGETMSETIGTMTSREACRVRARRMRHGETGKQAQGKRSHMKPTKKRKTPARADEDDIRRRDKQAMIV